jgi:hypothetical protein
MELIDQYRQVEDRLEESFRQNRFDTFTQLMSERLKLLRAAANTPDRRSLLALAKQRTEYWLVRLGDQIRKERLRWKQTQALAGYRQSTRPGQVINKKF